MKLNLCSSLEIKVSCTFEQVFVHFKVSYAIQWRFLSFLT